MIYYSYKVRKEITAMMMRPRNYNPIRRTIGRSLSYQMRQYGRNNSRSDLIGQLIYGIIQIIFGTIGLIILIYNVIGL